MKSLLTLFLITFISINSMSQFDPFFFGRMPNAKAEAMGRAYTAADGDLSSIFTNPAGTASLQGIEVQASNAAPYYLLEEANYFFGSAGVSLSKYLTASVSYHECNLGHLMGYEGDIYDEDMFSNMTLNLSSELFKDLYVGMNVNYFNMDYMFWKDNKIYFDLGVIRKFRLSEKNSQILNLGAAITNLTFAEIHKVEGLYSFDAEIPATARVGGEYSFVIDKSPGKLDSYTFQFLTDLNLILTSQKSYSVNMGANVTFSEIFSVRGGFYHSDIDGGKISPFTYGIGLQCPFYKISKVPMLVAVDYTSLPQPSYNKHYQAEWDNFNSVNLRVVWRLKKE